LDKSRRWGLCLEFWGSGDRGSFLTRILGVVPWYFDALGGEELIVEAAACTPPRGLLLSDCRGGALLLALAGVELNGISEEPEFFGAEVTPAEGAEVEAAG
jgi:hypothetical protein